MKNYTVEIDQEASAKSSGTIYKIVKDGKTVTSGFSSQYIESWVIAHGSEYGLEV
jgi:hypothetical protein